ncbi:MAG TPA: VIT and VWA domain-containing protein, partial [Caldilineaceae bacterium]|nr:VIT and VWA domain-containing protein [Caldilineaceae bacterium]
MFNPQHFYNSRGDGFPVLEITEPKASGPEQGRRFVPLQRTELSGRVTGPVADLTLVQRFGFSAAESTEVVEALYRFPLPGDAAVRGVTVRFGEVEIRAELKPRAEAEAAYAEAKKAGQQAALATRAGPNIFTLQVAGLRPDEPVTVETHFVQLAQAAGNGWSLRVPLTLAPRYVRADEASGRAPGKATEQLPFGLLRDPGHRFALDLAMAGAVSIRSTGYALAVEASGETAQVRLADGEVIPDRDLVLSWTPPYAAERPVLHVLAHDDPAAGVVYFLAQVAPPQVTAGDPPRRELTLLVDHSGSMSGPKWEAADWATEQLLRGLTPEDAFGLAVFHNTPFWFERQLQPGTPRTVENAVAWLKGRTDSGGTELGVALEQALHLPTGSGDTRAVLIVTDGQVTDHARLLQLADREFASPQRRRISVLCIDSAPNDFLALQLAERGGGVARFLTSSPDEGDITTALDEILADWSAPALAGLRLAVDRGEVHAVGRRAVDAAEPGWRAVDLGDLPAGRVLWVAGWAPRGEGGPLTLRLELGNGTGVAGTAAAAGDFPALAALVAARRIIELEYLAQAHTLEPVEIERRLRELGYGGPQLEPAV